MLSFKALGTHWEIDLFNAPTNKKRELFKIIHERILQFESYYSRFRPDSLIAKISQKKGIYTLPPDAKPLFDLYEALYELTGGIFTPLIGKTLTEAGYDKNYSLKSKTLHPLPKWKEILDYNFPKLNVKKPWELDFGAAGKGYIIDIVAEYLKKESVPRFLINAGGDIYYWDETIRKLKIGLEDPQDSKRVIGFAEITNESICASAGSRRKWNDFHHIIHPKKLASPKAIIATWAISNSTILADAMATCLFLCPKKLVSGYDFEYVILYSNYTVETSTGFTGKIF